MKPSVLIANMRPSGRIARDLLRRVDVEFVTLFERGSQMLTNEGIEHTSLHDVDRVELVEWATEQAQQRLAAIERGFEDGDFRAQWKHFDNDTWSNLKKSILEPLMSSLVPELVAVEQVTRYASRADLHLAIVSPDVLADTRAVVQPLREMGIPSLHVAHGIGGGTANFADVFPADVQTVYSEREKKILENHGCAAERIFITGNPDWDRYAGPPPAKLREETCKRLGLDPNRPIIVYAGGCAAILSFANLMMSNAHLDTGWAVLSAFADLEKKHPDWQFVLRAHPWDRDFAKQFPGRAAETGLRKYTVDAEPPGCSVAMLDVLLSFSSCMNIEAILYGKFVINLDLEEFVGDIHREGDGPTFLDSDALIQVRKREQIAPAIEKLLLDCDEQERLFAVRPGTIKRLAGRNDGRASERIAELAVEIMMHPREYLLLPEHGERRKVSSLPETASEFAQRQERHERLAEARNKRGEKLYANGDLAGAVKEFTTAMKDAPEYPLPANNLATVLCALGRPEDAWDRLIDVLHIDPFCEPARENLQSVGQICGREDEAKRILMLHGTDGADLARSAQLR